jgi:hypothetical protein
VVVVDLGDGLAVVGVQDAAGVLDVPSLLGDGCREEEGVQRGQSKPSPDIRAGRDSEQGRPAGLPGRFSKMTEQAGPRPLARPQATSYCGLDHEP